MFKISKKGRNHLRIRPSALSAAAVALAVPNIDAGAVVVTAVAVSTVEDASASKAATAIGTNVNTALLAADKRPSSLPGAPCRRRWAPRSGIVQFCDSDCDCGRGQGRVRLSTCRCAESESLAEPVE